MDGFPETECPKGRSEVIFRPLDDSWVLFDPRSERVHVLNLTAALVWTSLDGETSPEKIAEAVSNAFATSAAPRQVKTDVDAVLERFREAKLIE